MRKIRHIGMRHRIAGVAGALLVIGGGSALGVAVSAQQHAPQPSASAAGSIGPRGASRVPAIGPTLPRSEPVSIDIPAIGVRSSLLHLGLNPNGTLQVPPLFAEPSEAAWYKYSPTPGQAGSSIIEGHVDTYKGPSVFFRLGALVPGDTVNVTLADGTVAGDFDYSTGHYLSNVVVFASLVGARRAPPPGKTASQGPSGKLTEAAAV